jgi:hypothetical protein
MDFYRFLEGGEERTKEGRQGLVVNKKEECIGLIRRAGLTHFFKHSKEPIEYACGGIRVRIEGESP